MELEELKKNDKKVKMKGRVRLDKRNERAGVRQMAETEEE